LWKQVRIGSARPSLANAQIRAVASTPDERDFVRRVPNRRVVKVGHADVENERVLMEEPGRFQVVERF